MPLSEFDLITRFFTRNTTRDDVVLGIGDDAAVLDVPPGQQLVTATDVLVEGVHFPAETAAYDIGYKSLAVNLSDMAAMGAEPAWMTLVLTLPEADEQWLSDFSRGLFEIAQQYNVALVGGDTSRGPLSIAVQIQGLVPKGRALTRSGAQAGDLVYATGTLGDAGLALQSLQGKHILTASEQAALLPRLNRPVPRVKEGIALLDTASSMIDISDGLAADLGHILEASEMGASLHLERLPLSETVRTHMDNAGGWQLPLSSGDDYELCFTVSQDKQTEVEKICATFECGCTSIGQIEAEPGLRLLDDGQFVSPVAGYDHFAEMQGV